MIAVLLTIGALVQQHITTQVYGLEGPTVSTIQTEGSTTHKVRNLNGREVPVETAEDRLVSESAGLRIVERTIQRYDPNGRPGPAEKQRIETRTSTGSTEVLTITWRGDINGNLQVAERSRAVTEHLDSGNADTTVTIERPGQTGRLEPDERRNSTRRWPSPGRVVEAETTAHRDLNGRWTEVAQTTSEQTRSNREVQHTQTEFEVSTTGAMRAIRQTVSRTTPSGNNGNSITETDIFEPSLAGRAPAPGAPLRLTRQRIVERRQTESGATETISVRFPDPSSPGRLSPPRKVEEIVCEGKCQPAMMK